jgi:hypothetical protein
MTRTKFVGAKMLLLALLIMGSCTKGPEKTIPLKPNSRMVLMGTNMASRMMDYGHFEAEMQMRYPSDSLVIRNMGDGGNTPAFRPHPGRETPWAFEGAEAYHTDELANKTGAKGHFWYPDEWLSELKPDIIMPSLGTILPLKVPRGWPILRRNWMPMLNIPYHKNTMA